jgi:hypothetical protein
MSRILMSYNSRESQSHPNVVQFTWVAVASWGEVFKEQQVPISCVGATEASFLKQSSLLCGKFAPTQQWRYALFGAYTRVGAYTSLRLHEL